MQTWKAVDGLKNFDNSSNPPQRLCEAMQSQQKAPLVFINHSTKITYSDLNTPIDHWERASYAGCFITCIYFRLQRVKQSNRKTSCRLELREFTLRREAVWEPNKLSFSCTNMLLRCSLSKRKRENNPKCLRIFRESRSRFDKQLLFGKGTCSLPENICRVCSMK